MTDDLISRADAIDAVEWGKTYVSVFDEKGNIFHPFELANNELSEAINRIKAIPSAQPKIVRCKECKFNYANEHNCEYNPEDIVCTYWASDGLMADDFCSYGEKQTEPNSSENPNNCAEKQTERRE